MTRPSDHYPRRCGCGHHAADPLDALKAGLDAVDTPTRAGIGVEDATTPAPSTSDDIVSVSIALTGDRQLVELVAAFVIGGVS